MYRVWFKDEKGQAIIEYALILVLIVSCISFIAFFSGLVKNKIESITCRINCVIFESQYELYLVENDAKHSDTLYYHFVQCYEDSMCPKNFPVTYVNGKIKCSGHSNDDTIDKDDGDDGESVPFL